MVLSLGGLWCERRQLRLVHWCFWLVHVAVLMLAGVVWTCFQAEGLLSDCQEFLSSEEWYAHHGIPYRRGYLLYGPPGDTDRWMITAAAAAANGHKAVVTVLCLHYSPCFSWHNSRYIWAVERVHTMLCSATHMAAE